MSWHTLADRSFLQNLVGARLPRGWRSVAFERERAGCDLGMRDWEERIRNIPLGTTHTPPLEIANSFVSALPRVALPFWSTEGGPTVTNTLPTCTKNTICILREFLARLMPSGGSSTIPEPKKGRVIILAYWKADPATSRVTMDDSANAMSVKVSM